MKSFSAWCGGDLKTNFPKIQMPGGGKGDVEAYIRLTNDGNSVD